MTTTAVPQSIATIPAHVRREAFQAARAAVRQHLASAGYAPLDAIGELELLDDELRRIVAGWDASTGMVH